MGLQDVVLRSGERIDEDGNVVDAQGYVVRPARFPPPTIPEKVLLGWAGRTREFENGSVLDPRGYISDWARLTLTLIGSPDLNKRDAIPYAKEAFTEMVVRPTVQAAVIEMGGGLSLGRGALASLVRNTVMATTLETADSIIDQAAYNKPHTLAQSATNVATFTVAGMTFDLAGFVFGKAMSGGVKGLGRASNASRGPQSYPKPPGWTPDWEFRAGSRKQSGHHWFDPEGGEWRYHDADKWHPNDHWDYNPWTDWSSPWRHVPIQTPAPNPVPSKP